MLEPFKNIWYNVIVDIEQNEKLIYLIYRITKEVNRMQKDIQPKYNEVEVRCACGNTFMAGSTKDEIRVEICSECHPFYTGKQKNIEKGGRIDKFKKRFNME